MKELTRYEGSPMYPMSDIESMAQVMAKSRMFGFKSVEEAMSLMLMAQAEGKHPAKAAQEYHVIQGRPALKADAMLARFQAAGGVIQIEEKTDSRVAMHFSHPTACPTPILIDWTMDRAKRAGLTGKDNWNKYPRQMLYARAVSEGVRTCYPGVAVGVYTPEEVVEFDSDVVSIQHSTNPPRLASKAELIAADLKTKGDLGSDVPHIPKMEDGLVVSDESEAVATEKTRGSKVDVIERLKRATSARGARGIVTRAYNNYTFTQSERNEIEHAAEYRVSQIEGLEPPALEDGNEF